MLFRCCPVQYENRKHSTLHSREVNNLQKTISMWENISITIFNWHSWVWTWLQFNLNYNYGYSTRSMCHYQRRLNLLSMEALNLLFPLLHHHPHSLEWVQLLYLLLIHALKSFEISLTTALVRIYKSIFYKLWAQYSYDFCFLLNRILIHCCVKKSLMSFFSTQNLLNLKNIRGEVFGQGNANGSLENQFEFYSFLDSILGLFHCPPAQIACHTRMLTVEVLKMNHHGKWANRTFLSTSLPFLVMSTAESFVKSHWTQCVLMNKITYAISLLHCQNYSIKNSF